LTIDEICDAISTPCTQREATRQENNYAIHTSGKQLRKPHVRKTITQATRQENNYAWSRREPEQEEAVVVIRIENESQSSSRLLLLINITNR
jgi:hypothetical protein